MQNYKILENSNLSSPCSEVWRDWEKAHCIVAAQTVYYYKNSVGDSPKMTLDGDIFKILIFGGFLCEKNRFYDTRNSINQHHFPINDNNTI